MSSDEDFASPPKKKRLHVCSKKSTEEGKQCVIHCSSDNGVLISPSSIQSWQVLLAPAKVRHYEALLSVASFLEEDEIPDIKYHRQCRSIFTMKSKLEKIKNYVACNETQSEEKSDNFSDLKKPLTRNSLKIRDSSGGKTLPSVCIFCEKTTKYVTGSKTRECLVQCCEFRADARIKEAAIAKGDVRVMALLTAGHDAIAVEAQYHNSCYRNYTRMRSDNRIGAAETTDSSMEESILCTLMKHIDLLIIDSKQICLFTEITNLYVLECSKMGLEDVTESQKKNLKKKIEVRYGDRIKFCETSNGRLLVFSNELTVPFLVATNFDLNLRLKNVSEAANDVVRKAASVVRTSIQDMAKASEYSATECTLPDPAKIFLETLLQGDASCINSRVRRLVWSFGQDFIHGVTVARVKTLKHILLPYAVKTLTGNVKLVTYLNRLGNGLSYSQMEEIDTSIALKKISLGHERGLVLPRGVYPSKFTHLAWDNIDRLEETLSGSGTTHRVNGIIVQPTVRPSDAESIIIEKGKLRSLSTIDQVLQPFNSGVRIGPSTIRSLDLDAKTHFRTSKEINMAWLLQRISNASHQVVPSWTGYNVQARQSIPVEVSSLGYLPTINFPATDLSTVYEILKRSIAIKDILQLNSIACTFDQALYAKAAEILWKHKVDFPGIVLLLGGFHIICNYLSIIGKRFGDAGLQDILVESNVAASGSVAGILAGKQYNRGIRMHKLVYEALRRTMVNSITDWLEEADAEKIEMFSEILETKTELNTSQIQAAMEIICKYENYLRTDNGPTSSFWMSYIDMVESLLNLLRATREGNWTLYLATIREIIPSFFAYDHQNYARYLPVYYFDMLNLHTTNPEVHDAFVQGNFSIQLDSRNSFSRLPVDEVIEKTVNLDTQTAGGTKGFSRRPSTVERFYLTSDTRASFLSLLDKVSEAKNNTYKHNDLYPGRIKKDELDVQSITNLISNEWINPFLKTSDMLIVSSGVVVPAEVTDDLINARNCGEQAFQVFAEKNFSSSDQSSQKFYERMTKQRLKTCSDLGKNRKVRISGKEIVLKADRNLFAKMAIIGQKRQLDMKEVLSYPLGPLPMSLANPDGSLRKTNKSSLMTTLLKDTSPVEGLPVNAACIFDGMSVVQKVVHAPETFGQLAEKLFMTILLQAGQCQRLDVVFDVYREISIKNAERSRRAKSLKCKEYKNIAANHKIQDWRGFLTSGENKTALVRFLYSYWSHPDFKTFAKTSKLIHVTLDEKCFCLHAQVSTEVFDLATDQEEADTRLLLHVRHAAEYGFTSIVIHSDDTDVAIIAMRFIPHISSYNSVLYMKSGTQNRIKFVSLTDLHQNLGIPLSDALIGLHALTGCDSISSFFGKGKSKEFTKLKRNPKFLCCLSKLGNDFTLTEEIMDGVLEFVCCLYGASGSSSINDVRYALFTSNKKSSESTNQPPCLDCLRLHITRANYQAAIWQRSLERNTSLPSPNGHGWTIKDGLIEVKWMNCQPAPEAILELMSCLCSKECTENSCPCVINGMKCTDMCKLLTCSNCTDDKDEATDDEIETQCDSSTENSDTDLEN